MRGRKMKKEIGKMEEMKADENGQENEGDGGDEGRL